MARQRLIFAIANRSFHIFAKQRGSRGYIN